MKFLGIFRNLCESKAKRCSCIFHGNITGQYEDNMSIFSLIFSFQLESGVNMMNGHFPDEHPDKNGNSLPPTTEEKLSDKSNEEPSFLRCIDKITSNSRIKEEYGKIKKIYQKFQGDYPIFRNVVVLAEYFLVNFFAMVVFIFHMEQVRGVLKKAPFGK